MVAATLSLVEVDSAGVCDFYVPCHFQPLISRAPAASPELMDWAAASLSLQQRLLLTFQDQDLPFVSSHHNTALSRTHPSTRPTHLPRADSKTCRDSSTSSHEYILYFRLQHCTIPQFLLTLHCTTIPQDLPPGDRSLRRPDKPRPTQSPPPPLVRPDDRRIVYFITAQ